MQLETRYTKLNIFAKFQRSRTNHNKQGLPIRSAHRREKSVDEGYLTGVKAVAVKMAAVVARAMLAEMAGLGARVVVSAVVVMSAVVAAAVVGVAAGAMEAVEETYIITNTA